MRLPLFVLACAAIIAGVAPAQSENRIFIIANNADGYGVDRCLATGASCGTAVASAYCRSHEYRDAVSFRKVDRERTSPVPSQRPAVPAGAQAATNLSPSNACAEGPEWSAITPIEYGLVQACQWLGAMILSTNRFVG
jgi:hypothetical protein